MGEALCSTVQHLRPTQSSESRRRAAKHSPAIMCLMPCPPTAQVLALLEAGEKQRHIGETKMNKASSRSHTVFRMVSWAINSNNVLNIGNRFEWKTVKSDGQAPIVRILSTIFTRRIN